jgi:hypothetical protein
MKIFLGIAFIFALAAQVAHGGGIGGIGGGGGSTVAIYYYPATKILKIAGRPDMHFEIARKGTSRDSSLRTYYLEPAEFARLLEISDSREVISVQGEGGTSSYRVVSGEQLQQVELIDRRAAIRGEVR